MTARRLVTCAGCGRTMKAAALGMCGRCYKRHRAGKPLCPGTAGLRPGPDFDAGGRGPVCVIAGVELPASEMAVLERRSKRA